MRIKAVVYGTVLSVAGATFVLLRSPDASPLQMDTVLYATLLVSLCGGPGAVLCAVGFSYWLERLEKVRKPFRIRCLIVTCTGIPIGVAYIYGITLLSSDLDGFLLNWVGRFWVASVGVAGGMGLGLGCAIGTLRGTEPRAGLL